MQEDPPPNEQTALLLGHSVDQDNENRDVPHGPQKPFRWGALITLCALSAVSSFAMEVIFPFISQMIWELGIVDNPKRVGYVSGMVESTFSTVQFLTLLPCSYIADSVGRKPVILAGAIGVGTSLVLFGMSKSLLAMILSRCMCGAMEGSWAAISVTIGEMLHKDDQGFAFAAITITYRVGQVLGLPIGGILAHPEKRFELFNTRFWNEYPFTLPCFVAAAFAFLSAIQGLFFVKETLHLRNGQEAGRANESVTHTTPFIEQSERGPNKSVRVRDVLTPPVARLLISNVGMTFCAETIFAIFSLYGFTPIDAGGLGLSEAQIGILLAVRSVPNIATMLAFPSFQRRFGALRFYRVLLGLWPFVFAFPPLANGFARVAGSGTHWSATLTLLGMFSLWALCACTWTCMNVLVNSTALEFPEGLSRTVAVVSMSTTLAQSTAPIFGTSLFAFSIEQRVLGGNLVWVVLFSISAALFLHSFLLVDPETPRDRSRSRTLSTGA